MRANFKSTLLKVKALEEELNTGLTRIERASRCREGMGADKPVNISTDNKIRKKANFKEIAFKKAESTNKLCSISVMSTESSQKKFLSEENLPNKEYNICMVNITEGNIMTEITERKETLEVCMKIFIKISNFL